MKFYLWFNLQILDIHSLFYKYHLNPNSNPLVGLYYHPPNGYNAKLHIFWLDVDSLVSFVTD